MPEEGCSVPTDTLVLPGLNGSGDGHWQWHWLRDHANARSVEQDNWICPDLDDWRARMEASLANVRSVWLVAHSLGCILAANLADSPLASRVKGALLVAPCDLAVVEELHPCAVNFGAMPLKRLPFPSLVVGSLNDPYMDFNTTRQAAQAWGSQLIDLGHAGHINIRSGFGRWTQGYDLLRLLQANANETTTPAETCRIAPRSSAQAAYS